MAMSPREAFQYGFLTRCVEEGLSNEQVQARIKLAHAAFAKQAADGDDNWLGTAVRSIGGAATGAAAHGPFGGAVGLVAGLEPNLLWKIPLALAAGGGLVGAASGLNSANNANTLPDPADVKRQELAEAYARHAEQARRETARRLKRQQATPPRRSRLI